MIQYEYDRDDIDSLVIHRLELDMNTTVELLLAFKCSSYVRYNMCYRGLIPQ